MGILKIICHLRKVILQKLVALANIMRLSLKKGAHAVLSNAAWQEIQVRSGRDDNSVAAKISSFSWKRGTLSSNRIVISTGAERSGEICVFFFGLPFDWANELCRIPFGFVDLVMQPARRARPNDISFSILWEGKIWSFGRSGPRLVWGRKECGGGILRFNFSELPTTAGAYR